MPLQFPPAQYEIHESSPVDPTAPNTPTRHFPPISPGRPYDTTSLLLRCYRDSAQTVPPSWPAGSDTPAPALRLLDTVPLSFPCLPLHILPPGPARTPAYWRLAARSVHSLPPLAQAMHTSSRSCLLSVHTYSAPVRSWSAHKPDSLNAAAMPPQPSSPLAPTMALPSSVTPLPSLTAPCTPTSPAHSPSTSAS